MIGQLRVLEQALVDNVFLNGGGHLEREDDEGGEVEKSGPEDCDLRAKHARGDHGGDRVGSVMHPVEEVERQRQQNQDPNDERQLREVARAEVLGGRLEEMEHGHEPLMTISEM